MSSVKAECLMHEPVLATAARQPADVAIEADQERWTYLDLARKTRDLAASLRAAGIGPGDVVAINGHRSPQLVPAVLAVSALEAVFVILDPLQPRERRARIRALAGASAVLDVRGDFRLDGGPVQPGHGPSAGRGHATVTKTADGDPDAYVAFTSGTTSPRGVVGSHAPVSHYLRWSIGFFGHGRHSRVGLLAGLSHDPLLRDILTPLWCGGRLIIPTPSVWADPERLVRWLRESNVSTVHITPRMARAMTCESRPGELSGLRHILFGGDVLRWDDVRSLESAAPRARLFNCYGATETPQVAACYPVSRHPAGRPADQVTVPIGWPIDGWELELSGAGEILAQSAYLSRGYRNDPEETRRRYLPGRTPGQIRYRTGDLGERLPDGALAFRGRADRQTKIGGLRVEPAELEAHLRTHPGVADAAIVPAVPDNGRFEPMPREGFTAQDPALVAFVVPADGTTQQPDTRELRAFLAKRVPVAAVPAAVRATPAIPLTPNGKLDTATLLSTKEEQ